LKISFISAPVLHHFNLEGKIVVETDTFNLVVVGVLLQYDNNGILHPVTYISGQHSLTEINYKIYNKEHFMIICVFKECYPLLKVFPETIEIISDH
jgi:hypothetical protein